MSNTFLISVQSKVNQSKHFGIIFHLIDCVANEKVKINQAYSKLKHKKSDLSLIRTINYIINFLLVLLSFFVAYLVKMLTR